MDVRVIFLLFIIYSFLGWVVESTGEIILRKRLVNRGFLIGPCCPIYGVGSVTIIMLLGKYQKDPLVLFPMVIVICGILEYFTSYIMEKLFNARWWDYSHNKFNLNGRICLSTMLLFGIGGVFIVCFMNPFVLNLVHKIPDLVLTIITCLFAILFLLDVILSFKIIYNFKATLKNINKDNTIEITKKVRETLMNKSKGFRRLLNAFPHIHLPKIKFYRGNHNSK